VTIGRFLCFKNRATPGVEQRHLARWLDTTRRIRKLRLPYRPVPCQKGRSSTAICSLRSVRAAQSISVNKVPCGLSGPQAISKRVASFRLIRRTLAWRQYRLICSMDGQLFRTTEGGIHGGSRRGIEGAGERTRSPGPSYSNDWQLSRTPSHGYTSETEKAETDSLGSCTQEDFARAKGTMGEDQADV
jgi:hypothetical protein